MRAAPTLFVCALVALSASAVGCGDIDGGSQPFPGTILYQDPKAAFEFRLLEPPWIPPFVISFMSISTTFSVVPPPNATVTTDTSVLLSQALYSLQVSEVVGDPASAMATVKGSIPGGSITVPSNSIETSAGSSGVEMAWQENTAVFHRDAFLAGIGTPTFRLDFTAQTPIDDDAMIAQMINSFRAK